MIVGIFWRSQITEISSFWSYSRGFCHSSLLLLILLFKVLRKFKLLFNYCFLKYLILSTSVLRNGQLLLLSWKSLQALLSSFLESVISHSSWRYIPIMLKKEFIYTWHNHPDIAYNVSGTLSKTSFQKWILSQKQFYTL